MPTSRFAINKGSQRLSGKIMSRVKTISVETGDSMIGTAIIRLALAQLSDGHYPLIDDNPFAPGEKFSISISAPGGTDTTIFVGFVAAIRPHFESIESNCYLEILMADHALILNSEDRSVAYPDSSDSDIAGEILAKYNIGLESDQTDAKPDSEDIIQFQRTNDWSFLKYLAHRNGFTVYFQPDPVSGEAKCHFKKRPVDESPQPDLTILRENSNLAWIDFQISCDHPFERNVIDIDPIEKKLIRSDPSSFHNIMGDGLYVEETEKGVVRAGAGAASRHIRGFVPRDVSLNAETNGHVSQDHMVIQVAGSLSPSLYRSLLTANAAALIKGVGERLSGTYYINRLITTIENGDLTQQFFGISNALGRVGSEQFGQSGEEEAAL